MTFFEVVCGAHQREFTGDFVFATHTDASKVAVFDRAEDGHDNRFALPIDGPSRPVATFFPVSVVCAAIDHRWPTYPLRLFGTGSSVDADLAVVTIVKIALFTHDPRIGVGKANLLFVVGIEDVARK